MQLCMLLSLRFYIGIGNTHDSKLKVNLHFPNFITITIHIFIRSIYCYFDLYSVDEA
jgi:hypothetical protein